MYRCHTSKDRLWNPAPRGRSREKSGMVPGPQPVGWHNSRLWAQGRDTKAEANLMGLEKAAWYHAERMTGRAVDSNLSFGTY